MALDKNYFDSINIDVVKKKYYNANKVNVVFADIQLQAEQLIEENEQLRAQLEAMNGRKSEIGDAILTAQSVYNELVQKAKLRAEKIVSEAEEERKRLLKEAQEQQDYAVQRVEQCYSRMRAQHMASIEVLNEEWQSFLCDLYPGEGAEADEAENGEYPQPSAAQGSGEISEKEIQDRIRSIADELFKD